jgi:hypothetical protein
LYEFLYHWQTLVTGLLAIVAALIAAHPVRRQLLKMNIQASIMAREVLAKRLSASESRRAKTKKLLDEITTNFSRDMYLDDDAVSNPHWAFSADEKVRQVIGALLEDQASKIDSVLIDSVRKKVLESAQKLEECLSKIHAPDSIDLQDPDYALSEQDIIKIEQDADKAPAEIPECITTLSKECDSLENAFLAESEKLKIKICAIDDLIIRDQIG